MIVKSTVLDRLTTDVVIQMMSQFGSSVYSMKQNEVWFQTVCHGGDSHKLCYYESSKSFYCYTSCGSLSVFSLVMEIRSCTYFEALKYVGGLVGVHDKQGFNVVHTPSTNLNQLHKYTSLRLKKETEIVALPIINQRVLDYFESDVYCGSWLDEGISSTTMNTFHIRWYEINQSVIIPHYNINGELVGIRRRSFLQQDLDTGCKYMPLYLEGVGYAHPLGFNLYGLDQCKNAIQRTKRIILTESEKSVMLSYEFYGENSITVGVCGFNISAWQRQTILTLGVNEVILAFDKDFDPLTYAECDTNEQCYIPYQKFLERIQAIAYKFTSFCRVYVLWDEMKLLQLKDSPFDRGKEVFETLMYNKLQVSMKDERSE